MQDDLHGGIGEHRGERRRVAELVLQRVEDDDLLADADLDQTEERPVAALGHELRVDAEAPLLAGARREALKLGRQ